MADEGGEQTPVNNQNQAPATPDVKPGVPTQGESRPYTVESDGTVRFDVQNVVEEKKRENS